MNLGQLKTLSYAVIPGAKPSVINATIMELTINKAVEDIATETVCLKTNKKFNVEANKSEYNLSAVLGDYLTPDKPGLWWNNGTKWMPLYPRTLKYLDEFHPGWRDLDAGTPQRYSIDSDILTVSAPPETTLSEGFWLYYGKKPNPMTEDAHYPFSGTTTEYTHLSIFDMAIIKYVRWILEPTLNKKTDSQLAHQEYVMERNEKENQLYRRMDITASDRARFQGPRIGR